MREGLQRRARRMQENLQQSVGLSEKKDELQSVSHIEQRNQKMIAAVKNTRQLLQGCIKTANKDETMDKRKRRFDEYGLWQQLQTDSKELESVSPRTEPSLLVDVLKMYAEAVGVMLDEKMMAEHSIEKSVLAAFTKYIDEEKALTKAKEKLARTVVDVEVSRKRRLNNHDESRAQEIQDEYDALQLKLENYKDSIYTDIFSLLSEEAEIASVYKELVSVQMEYHRVALQKLENILPEIDRRIASYPRRPVFGRHLEDHLRYSNRSIAVVLEVCCSALKCFGFQEKGLFRVNGNNNRVRRLKAAFDAHQIDSSSVELSEYVNDPHSICSVLKCYFRELPEPLMTRALHAEWKQIANKEPDARKEAILRLLPLLPEVNRLNLAYLIRFLQLMLNYEEHTKMGAGNLAIVFGPNLVDAGTSDTETDNLLGSKLIETLITNVDFFFPNDHFDFTSPLIDASVQQKSLPAVTTGEKVLQKPSVASRASLPQTQNNSCRKDSFQTRATAPAQAATQRSRPKWPAPPPPANANPAASLNDVDEISLSLEHLNNVVSKSPSVASNDSMAEYGCAPVDLTQQMMTRSYQEPSRPTRPPPPRAARRSSSPEGVGSSVNVYGGARKLGDEHAELLNLPIDSSTNNRTVVHLDMDSSQRTGENATGVPKPPLPNKPRTAADLGKPAEFTKL